MKRVAGYARVSTDSDDQAHSFESQVLYIKEYIERNPDWTFTEVYCDEGISGTQTKNRAGLNRMLADARAGKIDRIITKEVSRLARNLVDSISITRELAEIGVHIYFMNDHIDTADSDGSFRLGLMSLNAEEESRRTSERVKWGQKRRMEQGVVFGRDMLGYQVKNGKLFLIEEQAEVVRLIFSKYLEGKGTHTIARELKEAGIFPLDPDGRARYRNDWSNTVILRILRNEKYVGDLCQKKTFTRSFLDHKKRYNRGEEAQVYIRDHHPEIAIVSRDMWDTVQTELIARSPSDDRKQKHGNRYWASGRIFCGVCGERFTVRQKKTDHGVTRSWCCLNHTKSAAFKSNCYLRDRIADKSLKHSFLYVLKALALETEGLEAEVMEELVRLDSTVDSKKRAALEADLERCNHRLHVLVLAKLDGEISPDIFSVSQKRLQEDKANVERALGEVIAAERERSDWEATLFRLRDTIRDILALPENSPDTLLKPVLEKIIVYPEHILEIQVCGVPYTFKLQYTSTGKLDTYRTEILSFDIVV